MEDFYVFMITCNITIKLQALVAVLLSARGSRPEWAELDPLRCVGWAVCTENHKTLRITKIWISYVKLNSCFHRFYFWWGKLIGNITHFFFDNSDWSKVCGFLYINLDEIKSSFWNLDMFSCWWTLNNFLDPSTTEMVHLTKNWGINKKRWETLTQSIDQHFEYFF